METFGPEGVVACSLTKTAARVLTARVSLPRENVGTLHALCYRAMGAPKVATGPEPTAEWNAHQPRFALSGSTQDDPLAPQKSETLGDRLLAEYEILRHRQAPREAWPERVTYFASRWHAWLTETERVDFTGMIEWALENTSTCPGDPQALVVDEAQDLSRLELALVRRWEAAADHTLLAGDDKQSIFGFRGATPEAFLDPSIDVGKTWELDQSYRLPRAIHARAENHLFCSAAGARDFTYAPRDAEGRVQRTPYGFHHPSTHRWADHGGTTMFLASCGFLLQPVIAQLRRRGIPFHNPYRPTQGAWNPLRGGADRLAAFLEPTQRGDGTLWSYTSIVRWLEPLKAKGLLAKGAKKSVRERAKRGGGGQLAGSLELKGLFEPAAWDTMLASIDRGALHATAWYYDHALSTWHKRLEYARLVMRQSGVPALRDTPRVIVGTCHSTKGGEADRVVLCPDISARAHQHGDRGETARTFYVGMTRAKDELVLTAPTGRFYSSL